MKNKLRFIDTVGRNILDTIGRTPLLRLKKVTGDVHRDVSIYAKLERFEKKRSEKIKEIVESRRLG